MKFSIIVVCFNAGRKLQETLNSIREQNYQDYEVILKDGLSTDHSLEFLQKDERIRLFSCKDSGIYDAMNQAVKKAAGEYYYFLNCGDSFHDTEVLGRTAQFIETHRQSLLYYGNTYKETAGSLESMPAEITPFTCYRHIPCHQACFYAKELFQKRQYDLSYRVRADYEHFLWGYFRMHSNPAFLGITVADYEGGGFSETKENLELDKKEHRMITELYLSKKQLLQYRILLLITLAPLRTRISRNRRLSAHYNQLKKVCYRPRRK